MKKILSLILAGTLSLGLLSGCGAKKEEAVTLDPSKPVSLVVWHYYNGAQQAAFDSLVSDFNATVGAEKGIYVEGYSQGSVSDLEQAVSDAAAGAVGSQELPNIFSTYADTAYAVEKSGKLINLRDYFTQEELDQYVPSYLTDGDFQGDGSLYLLPVAKSTEITMVDTTDWEPFAQATGSELEELTTLEGITAVSKRYYEWTDAQTPDIPDDGKAFYGRDSMSNYFVIGMRQQGTEIFDAEDGQVTIRADRDQIKKLWDNYYVPYVNGWFASFGKFRSDDVKTGELLAYTGSSSSAAYFPDQVILEDGSKPISYAILPAPVIEGGENIDAQQGAGMAVTKSDPQHEYAACEFLKWFTAPENNLRFVCESSYLPVEKAANTMETVDQVIAQQDLSIDPKNYDCLEVILDSFEDLTFYTTRCFENGYATRKVLDYNLSDKAIADKAAIDEQVAAGASRAEAVAPYVTEAAFDSWYTDFCAQLEAKAKG